MSVPKNSSVITSRSLHSLTGPQGPFYCRVPTVSIAVWLSETSTFWRIYLQEVNPCKTAFTCPTRNATESHSPGDPYSCVSSILEICNLRPDLGMLLMKWPGSLMTSHFSWALWEDRERGRRWHLRHEAVACYWTQQPISKSPKTHLRAAVAFALLSTLTPFWQETGVRELSKSGLSSTAPKDTLSRF